MEISDKLKIHSFDYKKGLSAEEARRKREDGLLDLRKANRQEALVKRRQSPAPSSNDFSNDITVVDGNIRPLITALNVNDMEQVYKAAVSLRKYVSNKSNPPIQEVVEAGAIPRLVALLSCDENQSLQFEAAWVLTNIASSTSENTRQLFNSGALPQLIRLLGSSNVEIAEQSCWALSNMAGDCAEFRDLVLSNNILDPLINLMMRSNRQSTLRTCAWALSNLCRSKPDPNLDHMKRVLPYLIELIATDDSEVITDAAWALSFICDENTPDNRRIQAVVDKGAVPKIIAKFSLPNLPTTVLMPLLRVIANIVTGNDQQTQHVLDHGGLKVAESLLKEQTGRIRKEVVWMLSNIAAGTRLQMRALVASGLPRTLITNFSTENYETKKEICWVISNIAASGDFECTKHLVESECIEALGDMCTTTDPKAIAVALDGLMTVLNTGQEIFDAEGKRNEWAERLEEGGVLDKIEQLQEHDDEAVYKQAYELVSKFFGDDEELEQLKPEEKDGVFGFGADIDKAGDDAFKF